MRVSLFYAWPLFILTLPIYTYLKSLKCNGHQINTKQDTWRGKYVYMLHKMYVCLFVLRFKRLLCKNYMRIQVGRPKCPTSFLPTGISDSLYYQRVVLFSTNCVIEALYSGPVGGIGLSWRWRKMKWTMVLWEMNNLTCIIKGLINWFYSNSFV